MKKFKRKAKRNRAKKLKDFEESVMLERDKKEDFVPGEKDK